MSRPSVCELNNNLWVDLGSVSVPHNLWVDLASVSAPHNLWVDLASVSRPTICGQTWPRACECATQWVKLLSKPNTGRMKLATESTVVFLPPVGVIKYATVLQRNQTSFYRVFWASYHWTSDNSWVLMYCIDTEACVSPPLKGSSAIRHFERDVTWNRLIFDFSLGLSQPWVCIFLWSLLTFKSSFQVGVWL